MPWYEPVIPVIRGYFPPITQGSTWNTGVIHRLEDKDEHPHFY